MTDERFWRHFWRLYRAQWGWRDVIAYPLVFLGVWMATVALFGWEQTTERLVGMLLLSALAWPAALWVVDHTVRRGRP